MTAVGQPGSQVTPAPPPGPGVTPPFAAPPMEGRSTRLWIGLGVAGLAVLLCCGGGGVALIGLLATGTQALNEQARAVVSDYLDAVSEEEYDEAYKLLCDLEQRRQSPSEFASRAAREPEIVSYTLGDLNITDPLRIPADVVYEDQRTDTLTVLLEQDRSTGAFEVCGIED